MWGDGGGGHWLVRMEWRPARWSVCLPLLIFPRTMKSRSSLLAPAHPDGLRKRAVKRLWWWWFGDTHTQPFYNFFWDYLGEPLPEETFFWTLWCNGRYQRQTHRPSGLVQPTSVIPHFYAGCPSCRNHPNLSWLGTGTKYGGLHTQWRGYPVAW